MSHMKKLSELFNRISKELTETRDLRKTETDNTNKVILSSRFDYLEDILTTIISILTRKIRLQQIV